MISDDGGKEYWQDPRRSRPVDVPAPASLLPEAAALPSRRRPRRLIVYVAISGALCIVGALSGYVASSQSPPAVAAPSLLREPATCAPVGETFLGQPGARFRLPLGPGVHLGPPFHDLCQYSYRVGTVAYPALSYLVSSFTHVRLVPSGFVLAGEDFHAVSPDAPVGTVRFFHQGGAEGDSDAWCRPRGTPQCYGWLYVNRGMAAWTVSAVASPAKLAEMRAFLERFLVEIAPA